MKDRCYNSNNKRYDSYGGRGIKVCDDWKESFDNFNVWALNNGYQEGLSIERVNVNDSYFPSNCTWITLSQQNRNKRTSILITIENETKTISDWCSIYGVKYATALWRYHQGYSVEKIFNIKGD